ncbi:MAG: hypothetical protein R3B90_23085 [Planctomycetaceae bacterium]
MARIEADREDLFAEARGLKPRWEWQFPGQTSVITAGFRREGGCSIYWDGDPVYHFDRLGRLRRAFRDGCLYRSEGQTLARLRRERAPATTSLLRSELTPDELAEFLGAMRDQLQSWLTHFDNHALQELRATTDSPADVTRFAERLREIIAHPRLAPRVTPRP